MLAMSVVIAEFVSLSTRVTVILLFVTAVMRGVGKGIEWLEPPGAEAAPEFVGDNAEQNALYSRLLQAEFTRIKADLSSGAEMVLRLTESWSKEVETSEKRHSLSVARQSQRITLQTDRGGPEAWASEQAIIVPVQVTAGVNLARLGSVVDDLQLLSTAINPAKIPEITIANVQWGPVLRWIADLLRSPAESKVAIFDEGSAALIEGPIVSGARAVIDLDVAGDGKKHLRNVVQPVAYKILASKLAAKNPPVDFGSWTALRDFVEGTRSVSGLVSQPQPAGADRTAWNQKVTAAARQIERAGSSSRDWSFIVVASSLFERAQDHDEAIRVLEQYAEFSRTVRDDDERRMAQLAYLRNRRVESTVAAVIDRREGDGKVYAAAVDALAKLPAVSAARKLHRLDGVPRMPRVKIAIVSGAKPRWFGIDGPPDLVPTDNFLEIYGAGLAQVVRELSPSADIVFVPVNYSPSEEGGTVVESDVIEALDHAGTGEAPIILLPFGPFRGKIWRAIFTDMLAQGRLVILPAGNSGVGSEPLDGALLVEGLDRAGERSDYSSKVTGSLGAMGEFPFVDLTDGVPTVSTGKGTSYAAAALAAIAAESIARQPGLRGAALRDALLRAATTPTDGDKPRVARVAIPR